MKERLFASEKIRKKIKEKHDLEWATVFAAWQSYSGITLEDNREEHRTNPPTEWFMSRGIKIVFVPSRFDPNVCILKSAYVPKDNSENIFVSNGGVL